MHTCKRVNTVVSGNWITRASKQSRIETRNERVLLKMCHIPLIESIGNMNDIISCKLFNIDRTNQII